MAFNPCRIFLQVYLSFKIFLPTSPITFVLFRPKNRSLLAINFFGTRLASQVILRNEINLVLSGFCYMHGTWIRFTFLPYHCNNIRYLVTFAGHGDRNIKNEVVHSFTFLVLNRIDLLFD